MAVTLEQVWVELDAVSAAGLTPIVFGGWAKEWLGGWTHGPHGDLDLLIVAESIDPIDAFVQRHVPAPGKQPQVHKRTYRCPGGHVELVLVESSAAGLSTNCYGHHVHHWQAPLGCAVNVEARRPIVATPGNIVAYERNYRRVEQAFHRAWPDVHADLVRTYGDPYAPYDKFFRP